MSYLINKKLCPKGLKNNPNRNLKAIEYITIHNTGNYAVTANAAAHANLLYGGTGGASWHYSVDKNGVYQSFDDKQECWHAGDGNAGVGNYTSIGIEICVNDKENFAKACDNATQLVADLLKKHKLSIEKVVQHNKWTGKDCPKEIRSGSCGITWSEFIQKIREYMSDVPVSETQIINKPSSSLEKITKWVKSKGAKAFFIELAPLFYKVAESRGIDPLVVYCQSAKETSYGRFGGVLNESYCNPCGMKIMQGGGDYDAAAHSKFDCWEKGIEAQVDHIALYAGAVGYPKTTTQDPRHFPYLLGKAKTVESLGGKWAPSSTYGEEIVKMMNEVKNTAVEAVPKADAPSTWAKDAWTWATANKITDGTNPQGVATREQVVQLIYNAEKRA